MQELSLFDLLPDEVSAQFRPKKSNDWEWTFSDYPQQKNGLNVFSCFACGGGSTMGYKLAGCDVLGCCEIDPKMNEVYVKNHNPRFNFLMDIREFNAIPNEELPTELFDLDILDGSPPCTTFSMAGEREESWGKKKKFREGQAEQTLDDLSFVFIDTVAKLRPKRVIIENVEGLIKGEAWSYVQEIYRRLKDVGYSCKHWLLKGQHMGVPQTRHRVFFVAVRNDIPYDIESVDMSFDYEPVPYGNVKNGIASKVRKDTKLKACLENLADNECDLGFAAERLYGKRKFFTYKVAESNRVLSTIAAHNGGVTILDKDEQAYISDRTIINASTFPQDYDFGNQSVTYICGMSVPPVMIKRIVQRLIESGAFAYKGVGK